MKSNTSGFRGVSFNKKTKKWGAFIKIDNKLTCLGHFKDIEDAKNIYNFAALKHFGGFARFN